MFERFTDRARRVVVLAQEEARLLNHNYIGTEHILLGLIHEGEGVAARALESLGISLERVREQVEEIIGKGGTLPSGHIPFTPRAKKVLELSLREALQLGHNYIGTEHILLGLIREGEGVAAQVLSKLGADLAKVRQHVIQLLSGYGSSGERGEKTPAGGGRGKSSGTSHVLDQFGRNLTQLAKDNKLDPVVGRMRETERVMQVLSRRTKNNPVLIGEPGVGKTAIVEGLAQRIATDNVPGTIENKQLYTLDLGALVAAAATAATSRSASRRSSRRSRAAATSSCSSTSCTPWWARGRPRAPSTRRRSSSPCWRAASCRPSGPPPSTSTASTSRRTRPSSAASSPSRSPSPVSATPSRSSKGCATATRPTTGSRSTDQALVAAANLADRYISDRHLPDKAIDLIDEAGSRLHLKRMDIPTNLLEIDAEINVVATRKQQAVEEQDFEEASRLRDDGRRSC